MHVRKRLALIPRSTRGRWCTAADVIMMIETSVARSWRGCNCQSESQHRFLHLGVHAPIRLPPLARPRGKSRSDQRRWGHLPQQERILMRQERKVPESNAAAYLRQKFAATDRGYLSASPMSLADLPPSRKRVHCPSSARSLSDIFSRLHR